MIDNKYPIAYASYNNDINIRLQSTSGGVFSVLAEYFIDTYNAVVYGAAFDSEYNVKHIRVEKKDELKNLRGSKYPQSVIMDCYKKVRKDLDENRIVLFTGTPCQVVGLKYYLKKEYNNLYCMDFVCHGVASNRIWRDYVNNLKKIGDIDAITFKYKYRGWKKWYFRVDYKNGKCRQKRGYLTLFMNSYLSYANIRPSCYNCKFKGLKHESDFTISDCWGIAELDADINDDKGLSALLIQNDRAEKIFSKISHNLTFKKYDAHTLMEGNWTAFRTVPCPSIRRKFFSYVSENSGMEALKKFYSPNIKMWVHYYMQRLRGREK